MGQGREILAVHVEDRDRQPVRDVGRERRRVLLAVGRREPELVVHHDVDRAADRVAGKVGEVERFGRDPLAGERRVAVQDDRHDPRCARRSPSRTWRARVRPSATGYTASRWLGFDTSLTRRLAAVLRPVGAGGAHVVLDVAAAQHALRVGVLEARVDVDRRAADDLNHDVQPAAVAHADERLLEPVGGRRLEHLVEERDEARDALEREPLRAGVAAVQDLFEQVGADQALEHGRRVDGRNRPLHALLHPAPARRVGDVHELDADRAAVPPARAGRRLSLGRELRVRPGQRESERIEGRLEVAPSPERVNHRVLGRVGRRVRPARSSLASARFAPYIRHGVPPSAQCRPSPPVVSGLVLGLGLRPRRGLRRRRRNRWPRSEPRSNASHRLLPPSNPGKLVA